MTNIVSCTRQKPAGISTKAGYIWASAADGFRRWRFVGMRVRTRCPADYADFAWIGVRIGAFSSESRNPPRLNRRRGSHFRALG